MVKTNQLWNQNSRKSIFIGSFLPSSGLAQTGASSHCGPRGGKGAPGISSSGGSGPKGCSILRCPCLRRNTGHARLTRPTTNVYFSCTLANPYFRAGCVDIASRIGFVFPTLLPLLHIVQFSTGRGAWWV